MTTPAPRSRSFSRQNGSTLVEFALASMMLFTTIFAAVEFGWAVWQHNFLSNLAQEGARYAAVHGAQSGLAVDQAAVATYVQSRAVGMSVTVTTWSCATPSTPSASCTAVSAGPGGATPGSAIEVRVQKPHTRFTSLVMGGAMTLRANARMVMTR